MKICWDNIKNMYLSKKGNLRINNCTFFEMDSCLNCKQPYLARKFNGIACCTKCHNKYGHTDECSTVNLAQIICGGNNID